jgi:hypothetical protein
MKHVFFCLFTVLSLVIGRQPALAQTPSMLRNDITIRPFFKIENTDTQTRIVYDASDKSFYTIAWNGELFHLTPDAAGNYAIQRLATSQDHQINYLQGLALHEGTIYLVGNVVIQQGCFGLWQSRESENHFRYNGLDRNLQNRRARFFQNTI